MGHEEYAMTVHVGNPATITRCKTTVGVTPTPCEHLNGTYRSIPSRWFGRSTVFVCIDCESVLDGKTKAKI